ncbi:MAG: hypothetical protein QME94_10895 [Anaerolineae bacterium]|nr:hypothetical protein [Anaerolineae bacterium]
MDELTGEKKVEYPVGDDAEGAALTPRAADMEEQPGSQSTASDATVSEEPSRPLYTPAFEQVLALMQEGRWREASAALEALEARDPESPDLRQARQILALRLSAERNWSRPARQWPGFLAAPAIRALIVANLALWLLVGILCLTAR